MCLLAIPTHTHATLWMWKIYVYLYLFIFQCELREVARAIARLIALALDLENDFFDKSEMLGEPIAILRLLHYEGGTQTFCFFTLGPEAYVGYRNNRTFLFVHLRPNFWTCERNIWSWSSYRLWFNHTIGDRREPWSPSKNSIVHKDAV